MASEEKKTMMAAHASHVLGLDDDDMMSDEDLIRQIEALEGQEELQLGDLLSMSISRKPVMFHVYSTLFLSALLCKQTIMLIPYSH